MNISSSSIGSHGELLFTSFCYKFGLSCSKPLNDDNPYDFIVDNKNKLFKIQVKTLTLMQSHKNNKFVWKLKIEKKYFETCDILCVYIEPEDVFYLIDLTEIVIKRTFYFYPQKNNSNGSLEKYKNNWKIFS